MGLLFSLKALRIKVFAHVSILCVIGKAVLNVNTHYF